MNSFGFLIRNGTLYRLTYNYTMICSIGNMVKKIIIFKRSIKRFCALQASNRSQLDLQQQRYHLHILCTHFAKCEVDNGHTKCTIAILLDCTLYSGLQQLKLYPKVNIHQDPAQTHGQQHYHHQTDATDWQSEIIIIGNFVFMNVIHTVSDRNYLTIELNHDLAHD